MGKNAVFWGLKTITLSGFFLGILSAVAIAAPSYVQSPPLAKVIKEKVATVKGGATKVPVITWGGDIPTIFANGNSAKTAKDSIFAEKGLNIQLVREDKFENQVRAYLKGDSPYLRGTMGMINMAAEVISKDQRTAPLVIYQLSWSTGGDALVVKPGIKKVKDLRGKTIALQAYGPHVEYLAQVLRDAGLALSDVKVVWLPDLTGTDHTPMMALYENNVDAAMVIIPDALALTSNGTVGDGSEDSVKGAKILLSTKTANRVIADVYAVRSDYYQSHRAEVEKFVHGLLKAEETVKTLVAGKGSQAANYRQMMGAAAQILLDSPQAIPDTEALWGDMETAGYQGNIDFFSNPQYPRSMTRLSGDIQKSLKTAGLMGKDISLGTPGWDFTRLKKGLIQTAKTAKPRFDTGKVASIVTTKQQQGALAEGELFSFEIYFKPNQATFSTELYGDQFKKVIDLASTYGGAIITVEGHSDPMGFLKKKKGGAQPVVLGKIKQSAKNLSVARAISVRDSVIALAQQAGISLDPSQFAVVGHGITSPLTGMCGADPCPPKTEQQWLSNMRVAFRIIQVEAESSVFQPL